MSYVAFLKKEFDIDEKPLVDLVSMVLSDNEALGGQAIDTHTAKSSKLLGISSKSSFEKLYNLFNDEKYIYHFPDDNATLARVLVKNLIPNVAQFNSVEESVLAKFDYDKLDTKNNQVNIRLNSLASSIKNKNNQTIVQYIKEGKVYEIEAKHTIMAGWSRIASHIIKDIPKHQKALLSKNIKMPLVYVQVALKNWKFLEKAGVATTYCPSSYFQFVNMDFPIKIGEYQALKTPDKRAMLTMIRMPTPSNIKDEVPNLLKIGRYELLDTTYEQFKVSIKAQLAKMYGNFGFNYEKDVHDIVINRWSHGYIYDGTLSKKQLKELREPFGNIYFANSDSKGSAYTDAAIDMAYEAVDRIKNSINTT